MKDEQQEFLGADKPTSRRAEGRSVTLKTNHPIEPGSNGIASMPLETDADLVDVDDPGNGVRVLRIMGGEMRIEVPDGDVRGAFGGQVYHLKKGQHLIASLKNVGQSSSILTLSVKLANEIVTMEAERSSARATSSRQNSENMHATKTRRAAPSFVISEGVKPRSKMGAVRRAIVNDVLVNGNGSTVEARQSNGSQAAMIPELALTDEVDLRIEHWHLQNLKDFVVHHVLIDPAIAAVVDMRIGLAAKKVPLEQGVLLRLPWAIMRQLRNSILGGATLSEEQRLCVRSAIDEALSAGLTSPLVRLSGGPEEIGSPSSDNQLAVG